MQNISGKWEKASSSWSYLGQALLTPVCVDYVYAVTPLLEDALTDRMSTPQCPSCSTRTQIY